MIITNTKMSLNSYRTSSTSKKTGKIFNLNNQNQIDSQQTFGGGMLNTMNLKSNFATSQISKASKDTVTNESSETKIRRLTLLYLIARIKELLNANGRENLYDNTYSVSSANYEAYEETETATFSTNGQVTTADGRTIDFNVSLEMTRRFSQITFGTPEPNLEGINFCDPLVINLNDNIADVSDQNFLFDIDSDGKLDNIKSLGSNSGFLALDLNNDGIINNGNELFGTKSGDGFYDLAKYDDDGNGWIDEADDIFSKLLIYTKDENGNDIIYHLKDKDVGAICLNSANTKFNINSPVDNSPYARIQKTGIFLFENGTAGTVQHLDMAT